jgi:hypothetical protein
MTDNIDTACTSRWAVKERAINRRNREFIETTQVAEIPREIAKFRTVAAAVHAAICAENNKKRGENLLFLICSNCAEW